MSWLRGVVLGVVGASVAMACSVGESSPPSQTEKVGEAQQAITAACTFDTIGLPCDPDGPAQPKLECEGACMIGTAGLVVCRAVTAGTNDGVTCGTASGIGDAACTH